MRREICNQNEQSAFTQGQHISLSLKISKSFLSTVGNRKMTWCGTDPNPMLQPMLSPCMRNHSASSPSTSLCEQTQPLMSSTTAVLKLCFPHGQDSNHLPFRDAEEVSQLPASIQEAILCTSPRQFLAEWYKKLRLE